MYDWNPKPARPREVHRDVCLVIFSDFQRQSQASCSQIDLTQSDSDDNASMHDGSKQPRSASKAPVKRGRSKGVAYISSDVSDLYAFI